MPQSFFVEKKDLDWFYKAFKKGILNLQPIYQRGKVWEENKKINLIDTVSRYWPIGLIMINVIPHVDEDGETSERYDVVDGQQRMTTVFDYIDGDEEWIKKAFKKSEKTGFKKYKDLSNAAQQRFDLYPIAVAFLREFEEEDVSDIYNRLQQSKPLKIGEKLKALPGPFKDYIREITNHKIFALVGGAHKRRDDHWNLSTMFFKSSYKRNPLDRQEYNILVKFLKETPIDANLAQKAVVETKKILNYQMRVTEEVLSIRQVFSPTVESARYMKWLFACIYFLNDEYSISGREHLIAEDILNYYDLTEKEEAGEWFAYKNLSRTGRLDTDDVKVCLNQLMNHMILAADAEPLDKKRYFTGVQRKEIFEKCNSTCIECGIKLSITNFHADHIKPYAQGGPTEVSNGQALCTNCNRKKGIKEFLDK